MKKYSTIKQAFILVILLVIISIGCGGAGSNQLTQQNEIEPITGYGITTFITREKPSWEDYRITVYFKPNANDINKNIDISLIHLESKNPTFPKPDWYLHVNYSPSPLIKHDNVKYKKEWVAHFFDGLYPPPLPSDPDEKCPWIGFDGLIDGNSKTSILFIVRPNDLN